MTIFANCEPVLVIIILVADTSCENSNSHQAILLYVKKQLARIRIINAYIDTLLTAIKESCNEQQYNWLQTTITELDAKSSDLIDDLVTDIARAKRRVGQQTLSGHLSHLQTTIGDLPVAHWSAGDAARVTLLLSVLKLENSPDDLVKTVFKLGSGSEQVAIVSGLCLYADDDRYLDISLEAGRTNSLELFRAVATHTPYPAKYYDEQAFNQLVLKSLFVGVNIAAIQDLDKRFNPELSRMCEDYYDERVAANRSVPADIWLALAPYASPRGEELLQSALNGEDEQHRHYAALATQKNK